MGRSTYIGRHRREWTVMCLVHCLPPLSGRQVTILRRLPCHTEKSSNQTLNALIWKQRWLERRASGEVWTWGTVREQRCVKTWAPCTIRSRAGLLSFLPPAYAPVPTPSQYHSPPTSSHPHCHRHLWNQTIYSWSSWNGTSYKNSSLDFPVKY